MRGGLYNLQLQEQAGDGQQDIRPLEQDVTGVTSTLVVLWTLHGEPAGLNTLNQTLKKPCPNFLSDAPALGQGP